MSQKDKDPPAFTPCQWDVWQLYLDGLEQAEIARELSISARTVQFHSGNIMDRHGCPSMRKVLAKLYDFAPKPGVVLPDPDCDVCWSRDRVRRISLGRQAVYMCAGCRRAMAEKRGPAGRSR